MRIVDILNTKHNKPAVLYELIEPSCEEASKTYNNWVGATMVVLTMYGKIASMVWESKPPAVKSEDNFVHLNGMVLNSRWKRVRACKRLH